MKATTQNGGNLPQKMKFLLTQIVAKICKGSSWFKVWIWYIANSSRCLHRGIRKMTVCTFRQASRRNRLRLSVCCVREQRSVGRWWCRSVSQSLASQIWFLLTQGWRLMVPIIGMFCCHRNCCPWCVKCRESYLSFSRTAHKKMSCTQSQRYCQISAADNASVHFPRSVASEQPRPKPSWLQNSGHRSAACLLVTRSRCGSTEAASLGCLARHGTVLLTAKLMSGAYDFEPVCGQEGDILNKLCDYVSNSLNEQRFQLCKT